MLVYRRTEQGPRVKKEEAMGIIMLVYRRTEQGPRMKTEEAMGLIMLIKVHIIPPIIP